MVSTELTSVTTRSTVTATVTALTAALRQKGITVYAVVDHAEGARETDQVLPDEVVVIFGNPAVGTTLMQHDPLVGIELPLRMLIFDNAGTTTVAFRDPHHLSSTYHIADAEPTLRKLQALLTDLAGELTTSR